MEYDEENYRFFYNLCKKILVGCGSESESESGISRRSKWGCVDIKCLIV